MQSKRIPDGFRRVQHRAPWPESNGNGDVTEYVAEDGDMPMAVTVVIVMLLPVVVDKDHGSNGVAA